MGIRHGRPASPARPGLHASLLSETLGRIASHAVKSSILADALADAGLTEIPEDPASFASFASGAVSDRVLKVLGEEAVEAVLTDLQPAFTAVQATGGISGVRRRNRQSVAPASEGSPVVLVGTDHEHVVEALLPRIRERAKVVAAYDIFALLSAAQKYLTRPLVLLLHDELSALRPSTLATLARVLPNGTKVIVWGRSGVEPEARAQPALVEWVRLGPVEELDAVADACLAYLPRQAETQPPAVEVERPSARPKVIVAHGDASWRARVVRQLHAAGYAPLSAPDGFMALERCIDERPALVLAGLSMPTLDGAQLAALLRSRFVGDAPPVVLSVAGPLPEPPAGVVALIRDNATEDDLLTEVAVWAGPGAHE